MVYLHNDREQFKDAISDFKLLPLVPQNEDFKKLVHEVRVARSHSSICPSAASDVDVANLLERIIDEKVYKSDYDALTTQLLEEKVSYDTAIGALKQIAESDCFGWIE